MVYTGQDTPDNMRLLFGPGCEDEIKNDHEAARIAHLLNPPYGNPPIGSFNCALREAIRDPTAVPQPRPATDDEREILERVWYLQQIAGARWNAGRPLQMDSMQEIKATLGEDWLSELRYYQMAINNMPDKMYTLGPGQWY